MKLIEALAALQWPEPDKNAEHVARLLDRNLRNLTVLSGQFTAKITVDIGAQVAACFAVTPAVISAVAAQSVASVAAIKKIGAVHPVPQVEIRYGVFPEIRWTAPAKTQRTAASTAS